MEKTYNPLDFEEELYKNWNEKGYFKAEVDETKTPYTIVIPPPNVTSKLHIGHALVNTLQDILIRTKRMQGYNALWVPGTDHASIATELKLVEKLAKEGLKKEDIGREKFLKMAWDWTEEYGGTIISQLKRLGCSCDWTKERFTMDDGLSNAVEQVFINLYNKGLIYKGERMLNWCPTCKTSLSDAEVEYVDQPGHFWHIKYKAKDSNDEIIIATTRPETMLGDTAIAVNPNDDRYKHLIGKTVILPLVNREIPIIADEYVDIEFGTGALKITPAHDPNDFEIGQKHHLEIIKIFTDDGKINKNGGKYEGLDRYEAREEIVKDLKETGALIKIEEYNHNVGTCYRCHKNVEPAISNQWFVKMEGLAKPAIDVVRNGKIKFTPQRHEKTYYNWMENIRDWCISRQLWWGHRIPAYYCQDCNEIVVSKQMPDKCSKCGGTTFKQDDDVLDTWFSSALWPFSTLGWPEKTKELEYFYPTNVLVTAYDIIFFWVARMIFSGIEHMGEIPFSDVLMHGLVRDAQGRKMSKSLGNGIDPVEVIEKYGADALRLSLILNISLANDIKYSMDKLDMSKNFANKIWNASKFVISNIDIDSDNSYDENKLCLEDKWILSKLNKLITEVTKDIDDYELGIGLQKIYDFMWYEFCDWYIEMVKSRLYDQNCDTKKEAEFTLRYVLENSLKLLHPFMPFITEKIFLEINKKEESIMISKWPEYSEKFNFENEEKDIELTKEIIRSVRNVKVNMNVPPSKKISAIFVTNNRDDIINNGKGILQKLVNIETFEIKKDKQGIDKNAVSITVPDIEIFIPLGDLVDINEEIERLNNEKDKYLKEIERVDKMLSNPGFVSKAPEAKINEEKEKRENYIQMLKNVEERLNNIKEN